MTAIGPVSFSRLRVLKGALRRSTVALPVLVAIALAGCASQKHGSGDITGSIGKPMTQADFENAAAYWGKRYEQKPEDKAVALNYAAALRRLDRNDQALAVLQKAAIRFSSDRDVLAAYGKALAASGDLDRALDVVRRAQTADAPDWRLLSAEAAILDQQGDHGQARKLYLHSLDIAPNEPTIMSNLGMSYLLTGELAEAERVLRQAAALPNADSRVRQNLALVVGLEGRFAEAEKIAGSELSPEQAAANVAYLKTMMAAPNAWKKLKTADTG
jgi:Flp pilus assembly protein TadD